MKKFPVLVLLTLAISLTGCQSETQKTQGNELYETHEPVEVDQAISNMSYAVKLPETIPFDVARSQAWVMKDDAWKTQNIQIEYYSSKQSDGSHKTLLLDVKNISPFSEKKIEFGSSMNVKKGNPLKNGSSTWYTDGDMTSLYWLDGDVIYDLSNAEGKPGETSHSFLSVEDLREIAKSFK